MRGVAVPVIRRLFSIPLDDFNWLAATATRLGCSMAAIIRELIRLARKRGTFEKDQ